MCARIPACVSNAKRRSVNASLVKCEYLTALDDPACCTSCLFAFAQVLVVTGVLMTAFQLLLAPPVINVIGIASWQRLGFIVGVPAMAAVPAATLLSWNYPFLFVMSVVANTLSMCALGAVSDTNYVAKDNALPRSYCMVFTLA